MRTTELLYELPEDSIAQRPVEPRHDARLLDTRDLSDHTFKELPELLRPGDVAVVNRTRVRRARLVGRKAETGARIELLIIGLSGDRGKALARPASRVGIGTPIEFNGLMATVIEAPHDGVVGVELSTDDGTDVEERIEQIGRLPLPPYFRGSLDEPERYQTIFAKALGSAAAPTAGLHFTGTVVEGLKERCVELAEVELSVGVDTFRPITAEVVEDHRIHKEHFVVPDSAVEAISRCRSAGGRVVAVGTTVARALETAVEGSGDVTETAGESGLFIIPGYRWRVVDILVTNFHVPGGTLVAMLASFMGDAWRSAYQSALERGYRFLSFGDAMLAERPWA